MGKSMKSSTLKRSTLSKENMEVIETLAKENENNNGIGEYLRPDEVETPKDEFNKAQEIDLLWQNFKATQFNTNSPSAYILTGFIIGVVTTLLVVFGINSYTNKTISPKPVDTEIATTVDETINQEPQQVSEENNTTVHEEQQETPSANEQQPANEKSQQEKTAVTKPVKTKKYIVKNGDTGESIIKHFYGAYTPERADAIIKVNNLKTLDRINIDQELLIPIEQ